MEFSVVIPTYNSQNRLPSLLEKLQLQTGIEHLGGELIIVDNNSSDDTAKVVQDFQANWTHPFPLKYVLEKQQGAAFARQRGLEEAEGELIGFLDDDNWPTSDWIAQAYSFGQAYPQAGAYGGKIHANYEVPPPQNFEKIEGFLAIRERGSDPNPYNPEVLSLPPGAAIVVRKKAWCESVPNRPTLTGKLPGGVMVQGDDWEPLMYLYKKDWEIWYNPAMQTYHQIPAWRLKREYLLSLIQGSCLSFCPLKMMIAKPWQKPVILTRTVFGNLYNAIQYYLKYHHKFKTDLVAECEMQIYLSRIASFFYFLRRILSTRSTY